MAGYLENFGAGEERREKIVKRIAICVVSLLIAAIAGYFLFRDYREKEVAQHFLTLLREKKFEEAYRAWGCPCKDYPYKMFLEDWGPQGPHGNMDNAKVVRRQHCSTGYLMTIEWGPNDRIPLFVNSEDKTLSIFPHPSCNFRFLSPVAGQK